MMQNSVARVRLKYILFIGGIFVITVISQVAIHIFLGRDRNDARLIGMASRQTMLSQRITKLSLFIQRNAFYGRDQQFRKDSLRSCLRLWRTSHRILLAETDLHSPSTDSLFTLQTKLINGISSGCESLLASATDTARVESAIRRIEAMDPVFLANMQKIVFAFQKMAEAKIDRVGKVEYALATLSVALISAGFIFILLPVTSRLQLFNSELTNANASLQTKEEEARMRLDQIAELQKHIEIRERQYRERVEEAVDAIYEYDFRGYFIYSNPVVEQLTGFTSEELKNKIFTDLVAADYRKEVVEFYDKQFRNRQEISQKEFPIVGKHGQMLWIQQTVRMVFRKDRLMKIHAVSRDISRVRAYRESLQLSEERFRALSENALIGIHQLDASGQVVYRNRQWNLISGAKEDAKLDDRLGIVHPDDRERVLHAWSDGVAARKEIFLEFRFANPVRGEVWVISHTTPMFGGVGDFKGFMGTLTDITEIRRAYLKLEKSEETYKLISTNSRDLITLHKNDDLATRLYISPSVTTILGYEPEELIGKSPFDLMIPDDAVRMRTVTHAATICGQSAHGEYRIRRKDGNIIWMESNSHPFFNDQGEMVGFQTSAREITERKLVEAELLEAKLKAEEANQSKSRFLSMMSHEIRTPMNAVIGLTNFLIGENPTIKQLENLKLIKFSGENLLEIINDILDFSKIEAGKMELEDASFDLISLIENIAGVMEFRIREKGLKFYVHHDDTLPRFVSGDSVRLNQVLLNLIGNAIKFTDSGSVSLVVKRTESFSDGDEIAFSVVDTGIGIDSDKIEMIFESFSQASKDTTRKFGGTGLGLTITRNLVRLMGSEIHVTSRPGAGSEFSFTVKLKRGHVEKERQPAGELKRLQGGREVHILLVEDNPVNQIVASNYLKKWGLHVTMANHGKEAIEKIISKKWDLVLMDLQMPVMDGYEASRTIRDMDGSYFKNIPIIALTASALTDKAAIAKQTGINDFVTKPFKPADLHEKIFGFLDATPQGLTSDTELDLSAFTQNDPEQEKVFRQFMANNLEEVLNSLGGFRTDKSPILFNQALHKAKTTLSIVNDRSITALAEEVKELLNAPAMSLQVAEPKVKQLIAAISEVINKLFLKTV